MSDSNQSADFQSLCPMLPPTTAELPCLEDCSWVQSGEIWGVGWGSLPRQTKPRHKLLKVGGKRVVHLQKVASRGHPMATGTEV